jgi:hypothetical protein
MGAGNFGIRQIASRNTLQDLESTLEHRNEVQRGRHDDGSGDARDDKQKLQAA